MDGDTQAPFGPFTWYAADDYARIAGVNLTGFFLVTQRAIAELARRYGGHVVNVWATLPEVANSSAPSVLPSLTAAVDVVGPQARAAVPGFSRNQAGVFTGAT